MSSIQAKKQKGFTLVEIAIVLVIIGLLIGGVLKGQEMITNAKLKRIESEHAGIVAAMFSYQDRHKQLPGDDDSALDRFTIYAVVDNANGGGDGVIGDGSDWNTPTTTAWTDMGEETLKFFAHLRAAGLMPGGGKDSTRPTNAYGGQIGIQNGSLGISGHVTIFGAIEGTIARILEARLDDGAGDSGRIQSDLLDGSENMNQGETGVAVYDDTSRYNMAFGL